MRLTRRALVAGGSAFAAALSAGVRPSAAQEPRFFRIATGAVDSSYFGVGTLIGNVVSSPPGARECDRGGCPVGARYTAGGVGEVTAV